MKREALGRAAEGARIGELRLDRSVGRDAAKERDGAAMAARARAPKGLDRDFGP